MCEPISRPEGRGTGACGAEARNRTGAGASCRTGPHPGSSGPCGAAFGRGREEPGRGLGAGTDPWRETPRGTGIGSGSGFEVPVPGVGGGQDRVGGDRGAQTAPGAYHPPTLDFGGMLTVSVIIPGVEIDSFMVPAFE